MSKSHAALLTLAAALAPAGPAVALPLDGAALQGRASGSEIRVNFLGPRGMEDHVWRLTPDGSVAASYIRAPIANDRGAPEYGGGVGRWSVNGNHLCVHMQGIFSSRGACFAVDAGPGNRVTLIGSNPAQPGSVFGFVPLNGAHDLPILRGTMSTR